MDTEDAASTLAILDMDAAGVIPNDIGHDGEAEPRSFWVLPSRFRQPNETFEYTNAIIW